MTYPPFQPYPVPIAPRSAGVAVALEIIVGLFGIFGIGNIYAGRTMLGIVLMVSFWVLFWVNFFLIFILIGWVTLPLTWIAYVVIGSISAARGVEEYNSRAVHP